MPKPTIAQLRARIGELEKEVITLRQQTNSLSERADRHREDAAYLRQMFDRAATERQALKVALKIMASD